MNSAWCSDRNPQPNCRPRGSSCVPKTAVMLNNFKQAQNGINRILSVKKKGGFIDVDGRPGSGTLSALERARKAAGLPAGGIMGPFSHCDQFAPVAQQVALTLANLADQLGAPKVVKPLISFSAPSQPAANGGVYNPPASAGITQFVSTPVGMAVVAAAVFAGFTYWGGGKKKKKAPAKKRAPRRKRRLPRVRITRSVY